MMPVQGIEAPTALFLGAAVMMRRPTVTLCQAVIAVASLLWVGGSNIMA